MPAYTDPKKLLIDTVAAINAAVPGRTTDEAIRSVAARLAGGAVLSTSDVAAIVFAADPLCSWLSSVIASTATQNQGG